MSTGSDGADEKPVRVPADKAVRRHLLFGLFLTIGIGGGIGAMAATTELSGAVIAHGAFVVDSYVKKVQHPAGGIVGTLNVRDGQAVKAGDVLLRLDDTQTRARLGIVTKRLDELAARRARLSAERDGFAAIEFPEALLARRTDPVIDDLIVSETRFFELRRTAREGQKAQLAERIGQLEKELRGLVVQESAKKEEIRLIGDELGSLRGLWEKKLVSLQRITASERDAARLTGEQGQLVAAQAQVEGRISETRLQIIQIDQDMRTEVAGQLREIEAQTGEYTERRIAAEDDLAKIDVRAPQDGVVHQLAVHTIGGVIQAGEPLMLVVPVSDDLRLEAKVSPVDIDEIGVGQRVVIRMSAFNQRVTPELDGVIEEVSPDLTVDQKTGAAYYTVRIDIPQDQFDRLGDLAVLPGMPAEAFIQTESRSILSYLVKPLSDQIERAFRES